MIITHSIWLTTKTTKLLSGKRLVKKRKELNHLKKLDVSKEVLEELKRHLDVKNKCLNRQMNMKINKNR